MSTALNKTATSTPMEIRTGMVMEKAIEQKAVEDDDLQGEEIPAFVNILIKCTGKLPVHRQDYMVVKSYQEFTANIFGNLLRDMY